jgi:amino acid transporter
MLGSGIFVLPGLAADKAGPAAALAYLIAGLVVFPAALSKAEMATAMPEAGGTYLFIDKSMGPLFGTIAGFGVWLSLIMKAAFALAGLGEYLSILGDLPATAIALGIAVVLTVLNIAGAQVSGRAQAGVVLLVVGGLVVFIPAAGARIEASKLTPFAPDGFDSVIAAAALVFVSYAGVTKIASLAEEVKRPGRNIPLGIIVPLGLMMLIYPLATLGMIGVVGARSLAATTTPIADVGEVVFGRWGLWVMALLAVLALISMANAGLLASSRYPFAMARNSLAPARLTGVSNRTSTPVLSIVVTGGLMVLLIAVFPLTELAKLASGFQLLVFAMVNLAPIALRSSGVEYYRPTFRSPLYPGMQVFGIAGSLLLLTRLGTIPLVGAVLIVVGGVLWYRWFGKTRASRESALLDALRIRENDRVLAATAEAVGRGGNRHTLVLARKNVSSAKAAELVHLGQQMLHEAGHLHFLRLDHAADVRETELDWDRILPGEPGPKTQLMFGDTGSQGRHSVVDHVSNIHIDLLLAEMPPETRRSHLFTRDVRWIRDHVTCDTILLRYRGLSRIRRIVILGSGGPADTAKVPLANKIAVAEGATIRFVHVVDDIASEPQIEFIHRYQRALGALCEVETESLVPRSAGLLQAITVTAADADLVIVGAPIKQTSRFTLADRIMEAVDSPVAVVHVRAYEQASLRRRALQVVMH